MFQPGMPSAQMGTVYTIAGTGVSGGAVISGGVTVGPLLARANQVGDIFVIHEGTTSWPVVQRYSALGLFIDEVLYRRRTSATNWSQAREPQDIVVGPDGRCYTCHQNTYSDDAFPGIMRTSSDHVTTEIFAEYPDYDHYPEAICNRPGGGFYVIAYDWNAGGLQLWELSAAGVWGDSWAISATIAAPGVNNSQPGSPYRKCACSPVDGMVFYVDREWTNDSNRGKVIRRFDPATGTQLPDVLTVPYATWPLEFGAIRVKDNGNLLVSLTAFENPLTAPWGHSPDPRFAWPFPTVGPLFGVAYAPGQASFIGDEKDSSLDHSFFGDTYGFRKLASLDGANEALFHKSHDADYYYTGIAGLDVLLGIAALYPGVANYDAAGVLRGERRSF